MTNEGQTVQIPDIYQGQRIDKVLAKIFPDYSRSKLTSWLKEGVITIDDKQYAPDDKVFGYEMVTLKPTQTTHYDEVEAEEIPINVVFEDEHLLVVNKPSGLIVHPGAGNPNHTLVNALLHHNNEVHSLLPRAGIIHRLDKDTTGLLVIAKTLEAHTNLVKQMQEHEISRQYKALVYGHIIAGNTITTNYGRDPKNRVKMAVLNHGKEAITKYKVAKHYNFATLLNVELMTGRTHQIRVHMAHINHAIIGDNLYKSRNNLKKGVDENVQMKIKKFPRQALHAFSLSFAHPQSSEQLTFNAPIPEDFLLLLETLDNNNAEYNS
ncbi:MAG: 23S rRNA pseudouridine(1911/1915/1917) synthase RluD [Legionellaceae bacterium]|nr:23S rRNA pseudouridine(1911/1915/1917) synthase RluD [Legionellaceae bacterium]